MAVLPDFDALFNNAYGQIVRLRYRFIRPFSNRSRIVSPSDYELDVEAFCVLSHAALEQLFEEVTITLLDYQVGEYVMHRRLSSELIMLLLYHGRNAVFEKKYNDVEIRSFDLIRDSLEAAKRDFSLAVSNNNGLHFLHLIRLLAPAAIDIQLSADERYAIDQLKIARGDYAHRGIAARVIPSPEEVLNYVYRTLAVARRVCESAAVSSAVPRGEMKRVRIP